MEKITMKQAYLKLIDKHKAILLTKLENLKSLDNDPFVKEIVKSQFHFLYKDAKDYLPEGLVIEGEADGNKK